MEARQVTIWICRWCGHEDIQNKTHCALCTTPNAYDSTLIETTASNTNAFIKSRNQPKRVTEIEFEKVIRTSTGFSAIDDVLGGGGHANGSAIVVGGDPGVGKSTLIQKILSNFSDDSLFISAEQSQNQVMQYLDRQKAINPNLFLHCSNELEDIQEQIRIVDPANIAIDSLHVIWSDKVSGRPGGITQCVYCAQQLYDMVQKTGKTLYLIMHVNKTGQLASSNDIKHCIDVDMMLTRGILINNEGKEEFKEDVHGEIVKVGSTKNRFGGTTNVRFMVMGPNGLIDKV